METGWEPKILSPLCEVPFNRWKVLPYYRHTKACTKDCVIIMLHVCISVIGKAQEDSQTAKQNINSMSPRSKDWNNYLKVVIHVRNIYWVE